jgi:ectoine hydroxylase-related dioxygenase (phytanoyl-CoA dioxygenase family)
MSHLATDRQQRYREDGIVFPVPVLTREEAVCFRRHCDALEVQLGGKPRTIDVRQMHLHFSWAHALATHPRILDAVEAVLGPDLLLWATELFAKHERDPAVSIGWHRDVTYMGCAPRHAVTAWIALSPSLPANGCMKALPGTERFHGPARMVPEAAGLVDVILQPGEMSLHDVLILHGSGPNLSGEKRVGFVARYLTPEARPAHDRTPVVLVRGRAPGQHFQLVAPTADRPTALEEMKESAARHMDAMLHQLSKA